MKSDNMKLTEKQQRNHHYHLEKLINMNILQVKKHYPYIKIQVIEQSKFTYSPLGKAFEKQIQAVEDQGKKQINTLKGHLKQLVKSKAFVVKEKKSMLFDK